MTPLGRCPPTAGQPMTWRTAMIREARPSVLPSQACPGKQWLIW